MQHAGWRSRGYIPHCDAAGIIQHIVMRTIGAAGDAEADVGQHFFKNPEAAAVIEDALLHFDGERYRLLAWCVMSNHVHVIAEQLEGWPLATIVHSWKSFTANEANRLLRRSGPLWQREYFDRFMRNDDHLSTTIAYVESNPVEAGLVGRAEDWRWSSARLRSGGSGVTRKFDPLDPDDLIYGTWLLEKFNYTKDQAVGMIQEYKRTFMNEDYCRSVGFVTRDDRVIRRILGMVDWSYEVHAYIGERRPFDASHDMMNGDYFDPDNDDDLLYGTLELEAFGFSETEARPLILDYKHKFMDEDYCKSIGIPPQLNSYIGHEGPMGIALHIYYYIGLNGDPNPNRLIDWRAAFQKTDKYREWRDAVINLRPQRGD